MIKPLITIEYDEYLKLQRSQFELRCEILDNLIRIIENNTIDTSDDLLRVIRTIRNSYQHMIDNMKEGEQDETTN